MVQHCPSLPLGCFPLGFVGRGCVWEGSSLLPLFMLAFDPPLKTSSMKQYPEALAGFAHVQFTHNR